MNNISFLRYTFALLGLAVICSMPVQAKSNSDQESLLAPADSLVEFAAPFKLAENNQASQESIVVAARIFSRGRLHLRSSHKKRVRFRGPFRPSTHVATGKGNNRTANTFCCKRVKIRHRHTFVPRR
ncbi:MAG: hypothetical protein ACE5EH_10330 [Gammaproteobacteria bacterium]